MRFYYLFAGFVVLSACAEKPSLCECMKKSIDINKSLNSCKNNEEEIRKINEQIESSMEGCNNLLEGLSASEKEEMSIEAQDCEFYPEFLNLFEVPTSSHSK